MERRKARAQRESEKLAFVLQNRGQPTPALSSQQRVETATRKRQAQLRDLQRKQQMIQERGRRARERVSIVQPAARLKQTKLMARRAVGKWPDAFSDSLNWDSSCKQK